MIKSCGNDHPSCKVCRPDLYTRRFERLTTEAQERVRQGARNGGLTKRRPLSEILVLNPRTHHASKGRLIREGVLENRCQLCGIGPEWNGRPLVLQLDHTNGNHQDWRLENLRILCPNCHTQTPTFGGRRITGFGGVRPSPSALEAEDPEFESLNPDQQVC